MEKKEGIDFVELTKKWSKVLYESKIFEANPDNRKKFFVTFPYPYLSGDLHLGHGYTFAIADAVARYKRLRGFNVLFPFAFHATGEPIVGIAKRIKQGDPQIFKIFEIYRIPKEELKKFEDPYYIVKYFRERIKESVILYGGSIDWRREFTTIDEEYKKFITWQYITLKEKGYVVQGTHPVIYCPRCKSPCGEHDRIKGEDATVIEGYIIKFRAPKIGNYKNVIVPIFTLRPETIFGVTNLWINPNENYAIVKYYGNYWLISEKTIIKFKDQLKPIIDTKFRIPGKKLVGIFVENLVTKDFIPILPAEFVDPYYGTGIVMSVPAHAPFDYIAFKEIKENIDKIKEKYNLDDRTYNYLKKVEPIVIIETPDFRDIPAKEVVEKLGIKSQKEEKLLEEATKIVYKKEYHKGVLNDKCKEFARKPVKEVKEELANHLYKEGLLDYLYETSEPAVCRCLTRCHVKILENQWFLKFSDEEWKNRVRELISMMKFTPEDVRYYFLQIVDWLKDKACARKSGLGTPLPWDKEWIVETLSDSVIYMAFYTIIHHIRENNIRPEQLTRELFDYVFLGKGDLEEVSKKTGIPEDLLIKIRNEFEYWYGFDLRVSGKDLIPNHLTFALFHHVAIWDNPKYWPKWYITGGMLKVEGEKMSKSKGNFIVLRDAILKHGSDIVRISLLYSAEGGEDPNYTEKDLLAWKSRLIEIYNLISKAYYYEEKEFDYEDEWLINVAKLRLLRAYEYLDKGLTRSAIEEGINKLFNDIKWYFRKVGKRVSKEVREFVIENLVKFLSIFSPFLAEEIWREVFKKSNFVALERLPDIKKEEINYNVIKKEEIVKGLIEDIREILKVYKGEVKEIVIAIPEEYKYKALEEIKEGKSIKEIIDKYPEMKKFVKELSRIKNEIDFFFSREEEKEILERNLEFIKREFNVEKVRVVEEKEIPENKRNYCWPSKFAILIK